MDRTYNVLYDILVLSPINYNHVINIFTFFIINTLLLGVFYTLVKVYSFVANKDEKKKETSFRRLFYRFVLNSISVMLISITTVAIFLSTGLFSNTPLWVPLWVLVNVVLGLIGDILVTIAFNKRQIIADRVCNYVTAVIMRFLEKFKIIPKDSQKEDK